MDEASSDEIMAAAAQQYLKLPREEIERIASEALQRAKTYIGRLELNLIRRVRNRQKRSIQNGYRQMVVLSGGQPEAQGILAGYLASTICKVLVKERRSEVSILYMYHDEFDSSRIRKEAFRLFMRRWAAKKEGVNRTIDVYEKTDKYLGTTFDVLVLDLNEDLKPNDVGRLIEIVRGGGLILLLVPDWSTWDNKLTIFKQRLLVPGFESPRNIFIRWFKDALLRAENVVIYHIGERRVIYAGKVSRAVDKERKAITIPQGTSFPAELYRLALTQDQVEFVKNVEDLFTRPTKGVKIVYVVTADRGRGKSCALGIALIGLAMFYSRFRNRVRIILTAPEPSNVSSLFALALKSANALGIEVEALKKGGSIVEIRSSKFSIEYWRPIDVPNIKGDIIAVDEASGIHVPQLHRIFKTHTRMIFTATVHGYEGAGRGFSVRFLGEIRNRRDTLLKEFHMETPIRYEAGDPIERWLYEALLLNAEPAELDDIDITQVKEGRLHYEELMPEEIFTERRREDLRQLFGIYVLAHYRNQPDDLGLLADAPHHFIRAVRTLQGKVVGAVQVALEGGLDDESIYLLLRGSKVPGNIIPDRLLKHLRIREAGRSVGYRIVRIATHPKVQSLGVGSYALRQLIREAELRGLDWVGSGFGVNDKLLRFWLRNGFVPLHMSPDKNPVSGEYTLIVLYPISGTAKSIVERGQKIFLEKLIYSLRDTYRDLETEIAHMLLTALKGREQGALTVDPIDVDRLWIYAYGPMTYEAVSDIVYRLSVYYFLHRDSLGFRLSEHEERLLVAKVLQGKDWKAAAEELSVEEIKAMKSLKEAAGKLLLYIFGKDATSQIGISLSEGEGSDEEQ